MSMLPFQYHLGMKHTISCTLDTFCCEPCPSFSCWVFFTGFHSLSLHVVKALCTSCADVMHFTPSGSPAVFCCGMCKLNPLTSTVCATVGAMFEVRNDSLGGKSGPDKRLLETFCLCTTSKLKVDSGLLDCVGTSIVPFPDANVLC